MTIRLTQTQALHTNLESAQVQLLKQKRMVKSGCVNLQSGEQDDNVAVPVPLMAVEIGDPRNILGVIIDRREDKDQ
ncbi:hypothetical protein RRG08_056904 [Elysia crispata]|uniref:Uncharacterized protein n=1 Tax=Elysia crispata TaxID=231223 RepID=A0AAE0Y8P0_9GAST|nr:hypothetical protein RRG08_056904 [Elysia crispata]